jgi:hypothetical protein
VAPDGSPSRFGTCPILEGVSFTQPPDMKLVVSRASKLTGTQLALLVLMVPVAAVFLQPLQLFLLRLQEGYFPLPLRGLGSLMTRAHARRVRRLTDLATATGEESSIERSLSRLRVYPSADRIMPTKLGNALRTAEDEAGQRYGLSTVTMWPRLYPLLSERLVEIATDARDELDLAARYSGTFFLGGITSLFLMLKHQLWLLMPVVLLLSAWFAYQNAIRVAISYGEILKVAFDMHRFDLLRALHLPLPRTPEEEHLVNLRLSQWFAEEWSEDTGFHYAHHE